VRLPLTVATGTLLHVGTIAESIQVCDIPRIVKLKFGEVALDCLFKFRRSCMTENTKISLRN